MADIIIKIDRELVSKVITIIIILTICLFFFSFLIYPFILLIDSGNDVSECNKVMSTYRASMDFVCYANDSFNTINFGTNIQCRCYFGMKEMYIKSKK